MNIAELFIRRPIATGLIMAGILIFGIMGYRLLPVSELPNVDYPTISINANLPGASPDTMAASVATPLEKQLSTIAGIDNMTSTNSQGSTSIVVQFNLSRNIDAAAQDVQAAIASAARQLPTEMPTPPSYRKVNPADSPVLFLTLSSPTLPLSAVDEYAETLLAQRISMINGVAQVSVYGSQKYAVRVQVDPNALAARGIGLDQVQQTIQQSNANLPTGTLQGSEKSLRVEANGQLEDASAFRPVIVAYQNGSPVRLGELARVTDSVENDKVASWFNNERAIVLAIQRQPGTNTVEVVDSVKNLLPVFREQMPAAVDLNILFDRSESIRQSINDVKFTLLLTICLVVLVIFLFLRNLSATIIPSLAVPMSLFGTFALMYLLGYTMDNLSMMALTLSVGFVVDDAIVMLENIVRHIEMGEKPFAAALKGAREIGFTIVSMTISLAAVFIPVLFMAGILGRLLNEFAVTIMSAILVSGFVSLTLTPMLGSRFLKSHEKEKHNRLYNASERVFDGMLAAYRRTLELVMKHRATTMIVSGAVLAATVYLFIVIPKGFIPSEDTGQLNATTEAAQDISFDAMVKHQQEAAAILQKDPNIAAFMSSVGAGGPNSTSNNGRFFIRLKPKDQRKLSADEVIQELRPKLSRIPGLNVYLQNPPAINVGGRTSKGQYQFTLQDADTQELYSYAPQVEEKIRQLSILQDVTTDLQITSPQITVDIDRDKAQALGISANQIESALYASYGQRQVSTIYTPSNQYHVIMEVAPEYQSDPAALSQLYVHSTDGRQIPLGTVATLKPGVGPLTVNHSGQLPSVTISFNLKPEVSIGDAVNRVQETVNAMRLPGTVSTMFQGTAQVFQSSLSGLGLLLLIAILVIYIVLGILYESLIHPLTILSGLPSAGFGALLTLMLFGIDLNLYAFVGLVMLIGIVKKNAIMMIDFALEAQRSEGKSPEDAIFEGCLLRFRPIMMTTMAALLGTLPIALGIGAGAESRRPLGLAVVGGLLVSQLLTLYITPVVYVYMELAQEKLRAKFKKRPKSATLDAPASKKPASQSDQLPDRLPDRLIDHPVSSD
ncbi:MAG: efflux RND transporter permease subunit [Acidobacteria bacterium]|nr:efflux RND transporter permease subunit [Acidobacteriota bacterium]